MTYLAIAAVVFVASVAFVLGFIVGSKFTKVYLKENGLLLEAPKSKACGEGCDCSKNPGSGGGK